MRSKLERKLLFKIWALCDHDTKGSLTKNEFILSIHLIGMSKRSVNIPDKLPSFLDEFLQKGTLSPE